MGTASRWYLLVVGKVVVLVLEYNICPETAVLNVRRGAYNGAKDERSWSFW
jgi:hypothetical protein